MRAPTRPSGRSRASRTRAGERPTGATIRPNEAARLLGRYSYFFKAVEQASLQQFERYEGRPDNIRTDYAAVQDDIAGALARSARLGFLRNYRLIQTLAALHDFDLHVFLQPEVIFEDDSLLGAHDRAIKRTTEAWYGPARVAAARMLPVLAERIEQRLGLGPGTLSSGLAAGSTAPALAASGAE